MGWLERSVLSALLVAGSAHADTPSYGKVETFQPGKKYHCVPTPDRKAWDCSESGKTAAPPAPEPAPTTPAASQPPPEAAPKASALPSYLTNAAASRRAPSAAAPAAGPAAAPPHSPAPQARTETKPVPPAAPSSAATAEKSPAPPPQAERPPAAPAEPVAQPVAAARSIPAVSQADNEFANLPGEQYVLELAHADSAEIDVPAVPHGKVYKLHLRQNDAERWLLLWGPFASIESARAARDEIAAQGATPGWPRRIAPLQAEARKNH